MNVIRVLCVGLVVMLHNSSIGIGPSSTAMAQASRNVTVSGVVLDANNARIVGATVIFDGGKVKRTIKSDSEGSFRVKLPAGDYLITVEQPGFKKFDLSPFRVQAGVCELVNIHMEVGALTNARPLSETVGMYLKLMHREIEHGESSFAGPARGETRKRNRG